jgi:hypothetical protein
MTSPARWAALAVATGSLFALLLSTFACGSSENSEFGNGEGSSGSSGGTSGSSGFGGTSGGTSGSGEGGTNPNNCFAPVDMFIMFDRSGSMGSDCNIGQTTNSKWCKAINALSGYFKSQGAKDQAAALQFFPLPTHDTALCKSGDSYVTPALPTAGQYTTLPSDSFDALLNSTTTDNGNQNKGTPTEAAIRGLTRFTDANRRGGRVTIGILITDGNPNGCDQNLTNLSNLLAAHLQATKIRTYVIGMEGASFDRLEEVAQGGGGPEHPDKVGAITDACGNGNGPCRHWNVGDGDPAIFTAALAAIQESADGCKEGGGAVNPK